MDRGRDAVFYGAVAASVLAGTFFGYSYLTHTQVLANMNEHSIESCTYMECSINWFTGRLSCQPEELPDGLKVPNASVQGVAG